jgi:hypothetical protein
MFSASPSCLTSGCHAPNPIGDGNNLHLVSTGNGKLDFRIESQSGTKILPFINQHISIDLKGTDSHVSIDGDPYPDFETVRYRPGQASGDLLAASGHAHPGGPALQLQDFTGNRKSEWVNGDTGLGDELYRLRQEYCPIMPQIASCRMN